MVVFVGRRNCESDWLDMCCVACAEGPCGGKKVAMAASRDDGADLSLTVGRQSDAVRRTDGETLGQTCPVWAVSATCHYSSPPPAAVALLALAAARAATATCRRHAAAGCAGKPA